MSTPSTKTPNYGASKIEKVIKTEQAKLPRIGDDYQASIPDFDLNCSSEAIEQFVWDPCSLKESEKFEKYLLYTKKQCIPYDSALTFLHWHNYDFDRATLDLPNYYHLNNRWNKTEIKRFLKLLDSKASKDFSNFTKKFPKHSIGELISFYYLTVSCLRSSRIGRRYETLWRNSCNKAERLNLLNKPYDIRQRPNIIGMSPFASIPTSFLPINSFGTTNDVLESDLEMHISNILGVKEAKRLLHRLMLDRPFPVEELIESKRKDEILDNPASGSNSEYCSQIETESTSQKNSNEHSLPAGIFYDHEEFLTFLSDPNSITDERSSPDNLKLMDKAIEQKKKEIDQESLSILESMKKYEPSNGFPKISYRWTKRELALTLTAISHLGPDFEKISKIVGTKSEAFIRNFYNSFNDKYDFESLHKDHSTEKSKDLVTLDNSDSRIDFTLHNDPSIRPRRSVRPSLKKRLFDTESEEKTPEVLKPIISITKKVKNRSSKS